MNPILYSQNAQALADAVEGALLLDLYPLQHYRQQHLPGAVHLDAQRLRTGTPPAPGMVPKLSELAAAFAEVGVTNDTRVIAYGGDMEKDACRAVWSLHLLGHRNCQWLAGGMAHWKKLGLPLEQSVNPGTPASFTPQPNAQLHQSCEQIMQTLGQQQIWDCRSAGEYSGAEVRTKRGGHIPGAFHLEWTELLNHQGIPHAPEEVRELLREAGCDLTQPVVTHCQLHMRSSVAWVIGKNAGLNISAYSGSWSEWGNRDDTPIET